MTQVTTTARRIARTLNRWRGQGGFCVFGPDGSGGAWYSERSCPTIRPDQHKLWVPDAHITAAEVQNKIDDAE